jgi:hypothetical protein
MADERVRWDGGLPAFDTPAVDPATGQWTQAWRPILEMLFQRTGGDFDGLFRAIADADAQRSQFAEINRAIDILVGQVAAIRDGQSTTPQDDRISRLESEIRGLQAQMSSLDATARAENIFASGENEDVSFKKLTVNNTANLKGNATVAGSGFQLGFFSYGGVLQQTVTFVNTNGAISGLTISNPPTQAEVQAFRDACETLADDTRALRAALAAYNLIA